ncbi:hypothetical protein E2C01_036452 [Portunus trituberculatus]|uniref:Uncharacterized protein n=1 Tax=Portunus trituberculatus TaxID=210409 RepID=A0A5B7F6R6_PORTR|nr:hypothetical protein [Portunus trituberculatus]
MEALHNQTLNKEQQQSVCKKKHKTPTLRVSSSSHTLKALKSPPARRGDGRKINNSSVSMSECTPQLRLHLAAQEAQVHEVKILSVLV